MSRTDLSSARRSWISRVTDASDPMAYLHQWRAGTQRTSPDAPPSTLLITAAHVEPTLIARFPGPIPQNNDRRHRTQKNCRVGVGGGDDSLSAPAGCKGRGGDPSGYAADAKETTSG